MDLFLLAIHLGLAYGLAGLAVRVALSVSGGFDLFVAVAALLGAEFTIAVANGCAVDNTGGAMAAAVFGILLAGMSGWLWSSFGKLFGSGTTTFVGSLGVLMAVIGFIGTVRGPGLRMVDGLSGVTLDLLVINVGAGVIAGLLVTLVVAIAGIIWLRQSSGYALRLYVMNPELAQEIGITEHSLRSWGAAYLGLCAGAAGSSLALIGGSTPELGMKVFLYGAGAALLFESRDLVSALLAGLILGALHIGLQLFFAPAWAESIMFVLVVAVLMIRGSSREIGGLR